MNEAKIKLSEDELLLAQNAQVILTKNAIIQKVIALFGLLSEQMQSEIAKTKLPEEIKSCSPKISRGENYKGLPYVILDYPRSFDHENIFAIRTMFWWGNYFSTTLHLKGIYKKIYKSSIQKNISFLIDKNISISTSEEEWKHEHQDNYMSLQDINGSQLNDLIQRRSFLKLSALTALRDWNDSNRILMDLFKDMLNWIVQP